MIEYRRDNLLEADAEALVNSVNTVGVMGKGIALQFKKQFPENFKAYKRACDNDEVSVGKVLTVSLEKLTNPRYIINFPTKAHWRGESRIEYVRDGLLDLVREVERLEIDSIAIPPLGCGFGGLDWEEVHPLILEALSRIPRTRALIYSPGYAPTPEKMRPQTPKPRLTPAKAIMLSLMDLYNVSDYRLGRLEAQKLAYFIQNAGEGALKLEFEGEKFGPYADNLRHLLQNMEGHYISGYGDGAQKSHVEVSPEAKKAAGELLDDHPETRERIERVSHLVEGFETPYGMELLATVHWVATRNDAGSFEDALRMVQDWNPRKGDLFNEHHVRVAWERLEGEGWISSIPKVPV